MHRTENIVKIEIVTYKTLYKCDAIFILFGVICVMKLF